MNSLWLLLFAPLLFAKKSAGTNSSNNYVNTLNFVQKFKDVSFSMGDRGAIWPIYQTSNSQWNIISYKNIDGNIYGNASRMFGSVRDGGDRYHVGIDLYCDYNDICVATEEGFVVSTQGFLNVTKALLLQTKSGPMVLYGEVKDGSWKDFGISQGSVVDKGQPICRIGKNQVGTSMLHFETYKRGTMKNEPWYVGKSPPQQILNPTKYLLNCLHNSANRKIYIK